MISNDSTDLGTLTWTVMGTPLGSLIAKVDWLDNSKHSIPVYDACWVTMRPQTWWADPEDTSIRYTDAVAAEMGYSITKDGNEDLFTKVYGMVEVEGEMITDYIPINPHSDIKETEIILNVPQLLYYHKAKNSEEIESYINQTMGRINPKEL